MSSSERTITRSWRRTAIGAFCILLLAFAAIGWLMFPKTVFITSTLSSCFRGGLVLFALWLAYPQLADLARRFKPRTVLSVIGLLALGVMHPMLAVIAALGLGAYVFIGWLKKPFPNRPAKSREHRPEGRGPGG